MISLPSDSSYDSPSFPPGYFVFALGDAAGEGLASGLEFVAGVVPVGPVGDGDDAAVVPGVFDSLAGSVAQPTAKASASIAGSRSVARPTDFIFGLLISLPRSSKIEKRGDDCPDTY